MTKTNSPDDLLDAEEAAALLRVKTNTVRAWKRSGRLKCVPLGDGPKPRLRFRRSDVEAMVRQTA